MRDEARLLGWLRHRNIVDVMDLTRLDGRVAVVMEYLEAVDCGTVIKQYYSDGARIPPRAVLEIVSFVAAALDAAFNQPPYTGEKPLRVIHRDIKPSNIMLDVHGTVKVLDFGVARADFQQREAATQEMSFGSFDYMSSERVFLEEAGPRSDVYSLGATCFELLMAERFGRVRIKAKEHLTFVEDRLSSAQEALSLPEHINQADFHYFIGCLHSMKRPTRCFGGCKNDAWLGAPIDTGSARRLVRRCPPFDCGIISESTDDGGDPLVGRCVQEDPFDDEDTPGKMTRCKVLQKYALGTSGPNTRGCEIGTA